MSRPHLELTAEVATTTDEGYPSALRVTLRNSGSQTVNVPPPAPGCSPDNGIQVTVMWVADGDSHGSGGGSGCVIGDDGSISYRAMHYWIRLRPGEYFTVTESLMGRFDPAARGTVHYWVAYEPPNATKEDVAVLLANKLVIPTEALRTEEEIFRVH